MKVLVIQPKIGMGDMIIYLPYIHAISKKYKRKITILVKQNSKAKELLADDDHIEEILFLDRHKDGSGFHDGVTGFINLIKLIKSKNFEKIFIFNSSLRYNLIAKFSGVKKIVQYPLFTKKDNIVTSAKLMTENEISSIVSTEPILKLDPAKINKIKKNFSKEHKHICLGVSASGPTKRWKLDNYIALGINISKKFPCKFYLAGGKKDMKLIENIMDTEIGPDCISFCDLKINETLPIIKNCDAYIGNDTGWLHISSALGLKCLGLFMDSPVMAYGKYSKNINVIIPEGETEETTTHNTLGADKISIEKVYNESLKLLSN